MKPGAGNLLSQAMAFGKLANVQEIREVVRQSMELTEYAPLDRDYWEERQETFYQASRRSAQ